MGDGRPLGCRAGVDALQMALARTIIDPDGLAQHFDKASAYTSLGVRCCRRYRRTGTVVRTDRRRAISRLMVDHFASYRIRALLYVGRPNWGLLATITPR